MRVIFDPGTYIFKNVDFTKKFPSTTLMNQLVFRANWSYIFRACFLPIDIAIRALCDLASSLEDSASMILVFATSKGVVRAPPMLPEMV